MSESKIGVISDTHGLLRPEAIAALQGVELILHAGDIGKPQILDALNAVAPVIAVRGNNDKGSLSDQIAETQLVTVGNVSIFMIHDLKGITVDAVRARYDIVISGHSHKAAYQTRDGVLFFNPGSAGPRRFRLPVTLGIIRLTGGKPQAEIIDLFPDNGAQ